MTAVGRVLATAALACLLVGLMPGAASAHGRGSDATNFRSRVTEAPEIDGVRWRVLGGDELIELSVSGDHEVIVIGHYDEPYLRLNADGAFENRRSPTVPLHRERYRTEIPGEEAGEYDAEAPPEWVRVSAESRWSWHDHRIHWMSPRGPDVTGETVLYPRWEIPVRIDGRPAVVAGELRWIPPPPWWPWLVLGLVVSLPALAGLRSAPTEAGRRDTASADAGPPAWPGALRPAAAVLGALALVNLVHVVEDLSGWGPLEARVFSAAQTLLYLGLGFGGAVRGRRGDYAGVTAMGIGAGALFLGQGLLYLPVLTSSQVGVVIPAWVLKAAVGASLVQLLPVGVALWRVGRVVQPPAQAAAGGVPEGPQATSS